MQIDRQTLVFFIVMFIFLSLPSSEDEPHSTKEKEALEKFEKSITSQYHEMKNSTYESGYGKVDGFLLSYQDSLQNRNISDWPFHHFNNDTLRWEEDEKYSIFPNVLSDRIKSFWGVNTTATDEPSYLLNISGSCKGPFEKRAYNKDIQPLNIPLPEYLEDYASEYTGYRRGRDYDNDGNPRADRGAEDSLANIVEKVGNITYDTGKISFAIDNSPYNFRDPKLKKVNVTEEDRIDNMAMTYVNMYIRDNDDINENKIDMQGVYFQDTGSLFLSSLSGKFMSPLAFPHMVMDNGIFAKTQKLVEQYFLSNNFKKLYTVDSLYTLVSEATDKCEYVGYIQFQKTNFTKAQLREIDDELLFPSGIPISHDIPKLVVEDYLVYSPDCGIVLEKPKNTQFQGESVEVFRREGKIMLRGLFVLLFIQLIILIKEIKQIRTPGQLSNISSTTVTIFSLQDSLVALIFLLATTIFQSSYLSFVSVSVLAFFMSAVFEMRFLVNVLTNQQNERGISWWEILRGGSGNEDSASGPTNNTTAPTETGTEAPPGTNIPGNPIVPPADVPGVPVTGFVESDEARISNGLFARTFFFTICTIFLIISAISWRQSYRRAFEITAFMLANSYWLPQFLRNTLKNRRRSFLWNFIIFTSMIRLTPIYYINFYKANSFRHRQNDYLEVILVTSWVLVQVGLMYFQETLGARFWINDKWLPKAFDYHPILNVTDLENGFSSDILANIRELSESDGDSQQTGNGVVTCKVGCTICMNDIDLPVIVESDPKLQGSLNAADKKKAQQYMIAPCHHIFHKECLEDWMKYKLQCPICRNPLPPV